ncbi:MAG: PEGA domain-containing protein [Fuerstiella sp.]
MRVVSFAILMCSFLLTGCVHRRVTINSSPQGALVRVDGKDIGFTPASVDFTWYGTREVQLLKDGFETETRLVDISAPWYQKFPLDFISDNFLGGHTTDHRRYDIPLRPKQQAISGNVIERGNALRSEAMHGL